MTDHDNYRESLLNIFSPPKKNLKGVMGLVCGLSAEQAFMDCVLERFSGFIALFQDAHNKPIQALPWLYNPFPKEKKNWSKIKLMHAKVALLGFGESREGVPDYYRLIVSTGNWTREAVNNSINLVWYCDFDTSINENQKQNAKDMAEAVTFWNTLLGTGNDNNGYYQIDNPVKKKIDNFLNQISKTVKPPQRGYRPRFISNLLNSNAHKVATLFETNSMGAQVIKKFCDSKTKRNFIICGSGFFEESDPAVNKTEKEPEVLEKLVTHFIKNKILTKNPKKWLLVNPETSGAAGQWIKGNHSHKEGWKFSHPKHPDFDKTPYPFHAKYIFIGNHNKNYFVTSGLLYIGSGNLSKQGFALGPGTYGNIETGVVFETENTDKNTLCAYFGIDPEKVLENMPDEIGSEENEQSNAEIQVPPPIDSCTLRWDKDKETGKLAWRWVGSDWKDVTLYDQSIQLDNNELKINETFDFSSGVKLSATKEGKYFEWIIPVFKEDGTFCSPLIQLKSGQELIDALISFPATAYNNENNNGTLEGGKPEDSFPASGVKETFSELRDELDNYPLHFATTLIETLSEQNQQITKGQLPDWIAHLRRTLIDGMVTEKKKQMEGLGINFMKPLIGTNGFAPEHATEEYQKVIKDIIKDWGINTYKAL
ncbi:hypothetical protein BuS5_03979 (plasmid) [Desulfosarcina sp. BuS5]|uniref:hypothetical protein n=1 Tax=Desulfosarcina sp. BuS5 TaxID=933262 RepID=UPI0004803946|nr:hypothetical protein [Desulfosarcina sp. BuS5]WDN91007.1 hypothetical protein BuS5_03979 [Desulfosarcina sp. BuS5]